MRVNVSWAFAGNAVYAACQWMVFVLLVRQLPLADVGHFAYAVAVAGPVFILANLRLRNLLATGINSRHGFADYLTARLFMVAAAVSVTLAIGALGSRSWVSLPLLMLLAGAKACDAIAEICHGVFQRALDMRNAAISLITNGVLSVSLVAVVLALQPTVVGATAAYAAASALTLGLWDLRRVRRYVRAEELRPFSTGTLTEARYLVWRAMPLGLSAALGSLQLNIPRYVIAASLGPASLAVFTALAYLPALGNLVANATAQAALPLLAQDLRTSYVQYGRRLRTLVQLGIALGVASIVLTVLFARPAVAAIYGTALAEHHDLLIWLMIAAALSYAFVFLGTASTARRRFGAQLAISGASTTIVAAAIVPLVSRYGLRGGALALCAGALVECCAYATLTLHDFRFQLPLRAMDAVPAEVCPR